MNRLALLSLETWKEKTSRRPLLFRGARQVGKTWCVRKFGASFASFIEINLESEHRFHSIFKEHFGDPQELIRAISLVLSKKITPGETLLFLDEIQASKEALLALRYFKEKLPELHVIAAGSLLDFTIKEMSFPVGRIESMHVFPMNFEEFLSALGKDNLVAAIKQASLGKPIAQGVHEMLLNDVSTYMLVGGMPEVVKTYIETKDLGLCQEVQQILISSFAQDFFKYASKAEVSQVRKIFDAVPRFLGSKFKYSNVSKDIKSRELGNALDLLQNAGLVYKVSHTSANGLPLAVEEDLRKFKVFFLDIGLSYRILGLPLAHLFLDRKELLQNRGGAAEQFVAQELLSFTASNESPKLYYWHREAKSAQAEVDFVTVQEGKIVPIEVKSAASGHMKSLHAFLKEKTIQRAFKVFTYPFSKNGTISTIPFYGIGTLNTGTD